MLKAAAPAGAGRQNDGALLVEKWVPSDSRRWISAAREAGLSPARVEDLGVALVGMRDAAHEILEDGVRWLPETVNPLHGVEFGRASTISGAHRNWVPPPGGRRRSRWSRWRGVIDREPHWPWQPVQCRTGTRCGLRLAEQFGLRHVDVDFAEREFDVCQTVAWPRPTNRLWWGIKPTKTHSRRRVPFLGSMHGPLLVLVRAALGLPADATEEEVIETQNALPPAYAARDTDTYSKRRRLVLPLGTTPRPGGPRSSRASGRAQKMIGWWTTTQPPAARSAPSDVAVGSVRSSGGGPPEPEAVVEGPGVVPIVAKRRTLHGPSPSGTESVFTFCPRVPSGGDAGDGTVMTSTQGSSVGMNEWWIWRPPDALAGADWDRRRRK